MKNAQFSAPFSSAFTLAELLMAVLVISIIMVALAPVITRRAYDNVSIEVNKKKGLEIYTNPGIYTFDVPVGINTLFLQGSAGGGGGGGATYIDKSVSFSTNTTWTIPKGVNQLTFTITGSGGGGGAASGSSAGESSCLYPSEEVLITRGASDQRDLCMTRENPNPAPYKVFNMGETCTTGTGVCCWKYTQNNCTTPTGSGNRLSGCNRFVCQYNAAWDICAYYKSPWNVIASKRGYRLPIEAEMNTIKRYKSTYMIPSSTNTSLELCASDDPNYIIEPATVAKCPYNGSCITAQKNACRPYTLWLNTGGTDGYSWVGADRIILWTNMDPSFAQSYRCVRPINRYNRFSGSGGASGAQYQKTINVLPADTLTITIGAGGNGGTYNSSVNNGAGARTGNGNRGGATQIVHKRGSVVMGTYKVLGGFGGWGATTSANGAAIANGTAAGQTTPSGTCYAQFRTNTTAALSGGNINCTTVSYSGTAGAAANGGSGGRVKNTGTATAGGTLYIDTARGATARNTTEEANKAKGQNATVQGFGGGGGLTPAWVTGTGHFFAGGKGANGKVDISYRVALPGAGGGAATRVGGSKTVAGENVNYEIALKVEEGSRLMFEIGSGGSGGAQGQEGTNGSPTIVGDNALVFLAGQGGKILTQTQKNNLSNCIGTTTNSTTIANCINNASYKPAVGAASVINKDGNTQTSTYGITNTSSAKIKYTIAPSGTGFKGNNGKTSSQVNSTTVPWNYGFDGGVGGAPFGIRSNNIPAAVSCGGGMSATYGTITNAASYICTSGSPNGNDARVHDPVNNEFGGSGGSGGGVVDDSTVLGNGSNGSSGYLRIRWDETENEQW